MMRLLWCVLCQSQRLPIFCGLSDAIVVVVVLWFDGMKKFMYHVTVYAKSHRSNIHVVLQGAAARRALV